MASQFEIASLISHFFLYAFVICSMTILHRQNKHLRRVLDACAESHESTKERANRTVAELVTMKEKQRRTEAAISNINTVNRAPRMNTDDIVRRTVSATRAYLEKDRMLDSRRPSYNVKILQSTPAVKRSVVTLRKSLARHEHQKAAFRKLKATVERKALSLSQRLNQLAQRFGDLATTSKKYIDNKVSDLVSNEQLEGRFDTHHKDHQIELVRRGLETLKLQVSRDHKSLRELDLFTQEQQGRLNDQDAKINVVTSDHRVVEAMSRLTDVERAVSSISDVSSARATGMDAVHTRLVSLESSVAALKDQTPSKPKADAEGTVGPLSEELRLCEKAAQQAFELASAMQPHVEALVTEDVARRVGLAEWKIGVLDESLVHLPASVVQLQQGSEAMLHELATMKGELCALKVQAGAVDTTTAAPGPSVAAGPIVAAPSGPTERFIFSAPAGDTPVTPIRQMRSTARPPTRPRPNRFAGRGAIAAAAVPVEAVVADPTPLERSTEVSKEANADQDMRRFRTRRVVQRSEGARERNLAAARR